ncbi:hypothetical protein [Rubinisphaera italica]|nr:hypothetical protein [Rubinisphaera italica]
MIARFLYLIHYGETFNPETMRSANQALEVYDNYDNTVWSKNL